METLFNIDVRASSRSSGGGGGYPGGNISISLKQRFQKRCRLPSNGREIILEDFRVSPYHFPPIQFPPNALTSPTFLYQTLTQALNLGHELCAFLHENISDTALHLSHGGLSGFHLFADVEVVRTFVVGAEGGDGEIGRRMRRSKLSSVVVEKLSIKPKRGVKPEETCAVCLNELEEERKAEAEGEAEEVVVIAMPCDHLFHASCISRWFEKQLSCPLCRRGIKREDLVG